MSRTPCAGEKLFKLRKQYEETQHQCIQFNDDDALIQLIKANNKAYVDILYFLLFCRNPKPHKAGEKSTLCECTVVRKVLCKVQLWAY